MNYSKILRTSTLLLLLWMLDAVVLYTNATYCSLDRMRKFAMEACEHIIAFESWDIRDRRSVQQNPTFNSYGNYQDSKNMFIYQYIGRSIYPPGGYLKVGIGHYRKLCQISIHPRYKSKHSWLNENGKHLYKRDNQHQNNHNNNNNNNISYCCYNKCEEDFFC